jgi:UTP-glucose-1-phosphate uridylyltransferase
MHKSGQWISGDYPVLVAKMDAQGLGSAITYARRYALQAMLGVAAEDDDGEAAMGRTVKAASTSGEVKTKKPEWTQDQTSEAGSIRNEIIELGGEVRFKALWEKMKYDNPSDTIDAMTALVSELRGMKE